MGDLKDHRYTTRLKVIYRDAGLCARHFFILGEKICGDHVHHVYGRGSKPEDFQESDCVQICLCVDCHNLYQPIKLPSPEDELTEQERVLGLAIFPGIRSVISRRKEN